MPTAATLAVKYCKTLFASGSLTLTPVNASRIFHKILYEFWGFCVNGGTSLTVPGAIAGINMPVGFQSGTVIASGADGFTSFGSDVFSSPSTDFQTLNSGSLIGKYLVTWIPGSPGIDNTDDGVYFIKSVEDASHIRVDIHSGGTRRLGNHPWFWDRQKINWRIVDIMGVAGLSGWGDGLYQVLQLNGAPVINPGQANSQVKITHHTQSVGNVGQEGAVGVQVSPGGTWTGSAFTDGAPEEIVNFFNSAGPLNPSNTTYSFIAGADFVIAECRSLVNGTQGAFSNGTGFHVEVPWRLYTLAADPNPICWVMWSNALPSQVAATYYNGFNMVCFDGTTRAWTTLVRSPGGSGVRSDFTGNAYGTGQWQQFAVPILPRWANIAFDGYGDSLLHNDQYISTDGVLSLSTPGNFSAARAKLRRVRFTAATLPKGSRLGDNITDPPGWVIVSNGVMWPWDDSLLPEGPWRFGV